MKLFEKSPNVAPILVRLYDTHRYYSVASEDRPQARAELTEAVADLLEQPLSAREGEMVADVLITLLRQAELDLRRALSERLSAMASVPLRLVLNLANDEISVAAPILEGSPVLSDLDLIYIVKSQGAQYWQSIAAREFLSDDMIDLLAGKRDFGTALVLSENQRIRLTGMAMQILGGMAASSERLARPLLMRDELPEDIARNLYKHVGADLKRYIESHFDITPANVKTAVDDLFLEFTDTPTLQSYVDPYMPTEETLKSVRMMANAGQLNMTVVMDTLKRGQLRTYIAMLSQYTGLSIEFIRDILEQPCGKKLAIVCRALDLHKGDFSSMYLLTHRMRSAEKLVNHRELLGALSYFDRVPPATARKLLGRNIK